jgi:hypothetical protein
VSAGKMLTGEASQTPVGRLTAPLSEKRISCLERPLRMFKRIEKHPRYWISDSGEVISFAKVKPKKLKQWVNAEGYHGVVLDSYNFYSVHVLVLENFKSPRPAGLYASHIDGNPHNNNIANLVWETQRDNINRKKDHGTMYQTLKSLCIRGHEFTHRHKKKGYRLCKTCITLNAREYKKRQKLKTLPLTGF